MGKKTKQNSVRQLKQLKPLHHKAIDLLAQGVMADYKVAEMIGVDPTTLSDWKRSTIFREELDKRMAEEEKWRRTKYRGLANRAAERLAELVECRHPQTALAAAREALRLAGDGVIEEQTAEGKVGIVILPEIKKQGETT